MPEKMTQQCKGCREHVDIGHFAMNSRYRVSLCNSCRGRTQAVQEKERIRNREISRLINWPALILVIGTYLYDFVEGNTRVCVYKSHYGTHALNIEYINVCPLTARFDV